MESTLKQLVEYLKGTGFPALACVPALRRSVLALPLEPLVAAAFLCGQPLFVRSRRYMTDRSEMVSSITEPGTTTCCMMRETVPGLHNGLCLVWKHNFIFNTKT